ncbi:polysaccharide deacetylase family protein [Lutimaribacter marinistellae]|uniref:Polysaccharide deacetylase family protein n=1 Tax=Lutimaribacter marinistellae TaxID=1820329 RepID=A0ABV7THB2_9RHOB
MSVDWTALDRELAQWQSDSRTIPLWWRDDDAVAVTRALERLATLSARLNLPVHLAVIPAGAEPELADFVHATEHLIPVQHGWSHANHATGGRKKAELGADRPTSEVLRELGQGHERMKTLFGKRFSPMLVPPWNRIAPEVVEGLPRLGFSHLSTYTPRAARLAAPGLVQVNTHIDPIDWKGTRGLVPPDRVIAGLVSTLEDRRSGKTDPEEPLGLLTHHLVHDEAIWDFTGALLERLLTGPARPWTIPASQTDKRTPE